MLRSDSSDQTNLPTIAQYPPITHYTLPDSLQTIVSSFSCSPNLITVANFVLKMPVDLPGKLTARLYMS